VGARVALSPEETPRAFTGNRIAVRFEYEFHDASGRCFRAHGNENWEFDDLGYLDSGRTNYVGNAAIAAGELAQDVGIPEGAAFTTGLLHETAGRSWRLASRPFTPV
jgi:hypothetical protein